MFPTTIVKDDTTIRKFMRWVLMSALEWFRDEELGDYQDAMIIVRKGYASQIYYGMNSVSYEPAKIEERTKWINTKDWNALNSPRKVTLEKLEELFEKYLDECDIGRSQKYGYTVLEITWPKEIEIKVFDNDAFVKGRQSMSKAYCILTVLSKHPDWIGAEITKGNKAFAESLPIGFDKKDKVIYEGKDATYVTRNGLMYSQAKSRTEFQKNRDCLKVIKHNIGYENWEKDLEKQLK